ncbi:MAG: hypothetical protein A2219_07595 [Elusimicrobia bacterium RIFOXYA2_FULL_50_26]|nr:MAG: hypothetical protein A2219_07595 [Elusimicrobia bacterium RIFOXYA2_FULL_50_26]
MPACVALLLVHRFHKRIHVSDTNNAAAVQVSPAVARKIARVIDGDTLALSNGETVRLIGVDTPELHHPELPVQRFAQEAQAFLQSMAEGAGCRLEFEPGKQRDSYGRLLAYVYVDDKMLNAEILRRGYGYAYTRFPFSRMSEFISLEHNARQCQYGLWNYSLTDGAVARLLTDYESLSMEGRRELNNFMQNIIKKYPGAGAPAIADGLDAGRKLPENVGWRDAADYYGKYITVDGRIVASHNSGKVCLLNFHKDYKRYLTAVIFSNSFSLFPENPEKYYLNRVIRVTGCVREYKGKPEIILERPEQVTVLD